jgi:hypothetical protein
LLFHSNAFVDNLGDASIKSEDKWKEWFFQQLTCAEPRITYKMDAIYEPNEERYAILFNMDQAEFQIGSMNLWSTSFNVLPKVRSIIFFANVASYSSYL